MYWLAALSIGAYLGCVGLLLPQLVFAQNKKHSIGTKFTFNRAGLLGLSVLSVGLHIIFSYQLLNTGADVYHFTFFNVLNLIVLFSVLVTTVALFYLNTLWFLLPIIYFLAILSILITLFLPDFSVNHIQVNSSALLHVVIALSAYAFYLMAILYAFQQLWIQRKLKQKKIVFSPLLPSLITIERQFLVLVTLGQIFLTVVIVGGVISLVQDYHVMQMQKMVFSFIAWLIFGLLIVGYKVLYWRGKRVVIYTLSGIIFITIAYFGGHVFFFR